MGLSQGRAVLFRAGALLCGLLVALAIGEGVVRALGFAPRLFVVHASNYTLNDNPILRFGLLPGSEDGDFKINEGGLRERELPKAKPDNTVRIALLGDSIVYGWRVPQDRTMSRRLEQELNQLTGDDGPRFQVINFGVCGYNTWQVMERARQDAMAYDPDVLVYGYALNDLDASSNLLEGVLKEKQAATTGLEGQVSAGLGRLALHSNLIVWLYSWWQQEQPMAHNPPVTWGAGLPNQNDPKFKDKQRFFGRILVKQITGRHMDKRHQIAANMDKFKRLGQSAGIPVGVAIFPIKLVDDPEEYPLQAVHEVIAQAAEDHDVQVLDLLTGYRAANPKFGSAYFTDVLHPNEQGHLVAARAMAPWLLEQVIGNTVPSLP